VSTLSTSDTIRFRPKQPRQGYPQAWPVLLADLGAPEDLARRLWALLSESYPETAQRVAYRLARMFDTRTDGDIEALYRQVLQDLAPAMLFSMTLRISPEGQRRRRAVVQFEEAALDRITAGPDGQPGWKP
jgi:hypothetical protein